MTERMIVRLKSLVHLPERRSTALGAPPAWRPLRYPMFAVALACGLATPSPANVPVVEYSAMPAVDCVINPYRVVDISSPVPGVIEKLYVERSQPVAAGDVVAELVADVERANVELARYRAGMQSEIGLGRVNMSFDRLRKKRVDSLHESRNISQENADQIEREVQLSQWKLRQAKELLDVRKLELRRAEQQLRQKSIRAPFDGFVLDTFKYRGEYVEEQAILRLAQLDPLVIETIVPMEHFGKIRAGMQAEIRPEVLLKDKLTATVTVVDRIGDTASNTFGVRLSMPNPEHRIPAGLKCIVKFIDTPAAQLAAAPPDDSGPDAAAPAVADAVAADILADESGADEAPPPALLASLQIDEVVAAPPLDPVEAEQAPGDDDSAGYGPQTPSSYMVLIAQPDDAAAARALVANLRAAGVDDLLKIDHGANRGTISLGVFANRAYALGRQRQMDALGFDAYLVERFK